MASGRLERIKKALLGALAGGLLLQVGSCTTQAVKTQVANGLSATMNGLFNMVSTDLANEVLDVDD